ncbi:putative nucleotidyltransferase with HDIG domain [Lachnotalea glycerini]|uniref:HD-GYP domain-containing protein n=1 Tax=Lachnotalea glycerini TaxID=1763509 RepID=A0A255IHF7_9FIRM|nr:HD-GYP domain-containing protein [Lachnotalea glycerini]PXV91781.1 putative nucleotidyltransferase with HDIG domain [Lachnotalea glycerini]RDY27368.1 HD-GYP domain-containing protein [Lachnotalea glycerini]
MKRVLTKDLIPGMITAENVYTISGQLILPENLKLTDKMIIRLEFYAIEEITVVDDTEQVATKPVSLYREKIDNSLEFKKFREIFFENVEYFQNSINTVINRITPIDTYSLLTNTLNIFSSNLTSIGVFDMLHNMREYDDVTYHHSMSVGIICNIMGKWLGFSKEDTEVLTLAGLLHDTGKIMMPDNILKKPSRLSVTEYEIIKTHPFQGYNLLKGEDLDERIKNAALMHHERCDGSGYPSRLVSNEIDDFAKIVAIADVYDAMTSARIYRGPLCPFDVIHIFESEGLRKFEPRFLLPFLERIVNTYMNNDILLNNGETGTIIMINRLYLSKPVIKTATGFIDLSAEPDLYIMKIL